MYAYGLCDRVNWLWLIEFKFRVKYVYTIGHDPPRPPILPYFYTEPIVTARPIYYVYIGTL